MTSAYYSGPRNNRTPGYLTEDLELRIVSGPPRYERHTEKAVEHVTLRRSGGEVMGYTSTARGLKPGEALNELLQAANPRSHIVPGSRATSANLDALGALAGV